MITAKKTNKIPELEILLRVNSTHKRNFIQTYSGTKVDTTFIKVVPFPANEWSAFWYKLKCITKGIQKTCFQLATKNEPLEK